MKYYCCTSVLKFHKLSFDKDYKCCYLLPTLTAGTYILKHLNLLQPKLQTTIGIRNSNPAFLAPDVTRWDFWLWGVALPTKMSLVERCKTFRSKWINRFVFVFVYKSNIECSWGRWRNWILFKLVVLITVFAFFFCSCVVQVFTLSSIYFEIRVQLKTYKIFFWTKNSRTQNIAWFANV